MAKTKTTQAKRNDTNEVAFTGVVKRVNYSSTKMASYNVDIATLTPKGNEAHTWIDVIDFTRNIDFEENDYIIVKGALMTQSYEGKTGTVYKTVIKATEMVVMG